MGAGDTWFREPGQLEPELHGPMMGCLCPSPGELDSFTANQHLPCMVFVGTSGDSSTEDTSEHVDESLWSPRLVWLLPSMIAGLLPSSLLSPVTTQIQQNWWAGLDCTLKSVDDPGCKHALSQASIAISVATAVGSGLGFLMAPMFGRLSDTFGRRPIFIIASVVAVPFAFFIFATSQWNWSLYYFYAAWMLLTVSPDFVGFSAFIADVSSKKQRLHSFGLLVGAFAFCRCVGPLLGVKLQNPNNFYAAIALTVFGVLYNVFVLPESLDSGLRKPFASDALNPFAALAILNRYSLFRRLAMVVALSSCTISGVIDISQLYSRSRFGFTKEDNALLSEAWGITGIIVQFILLPCLVRCVSSRRILLLGLCIQASAVVGEGLAPTKLLLFVATAFSALGSLTFPSVSAIKSLNASDSEQGTIQGALAGMQQLSSVVGPLMFGSLLSVGQDHGMPQLPYFLGGFLVALAIIASLTLPGGIDTGEPMNADIKSVDVVTLIDSVADSTRVSLVPYEEPEGSIQSSYRRMSDVSS